MAVVAAMATLLGLIAFALVVDVGRLYWAHRDLQRAANLAALDAARVAGGCLGVTIDPSLRAMREVEDSLARNGLSDAKIDTVRLGREIHSAEGMREFVAGVPGQANMAVQVVLSRAMPRRLLPVAPRASGVLRASAAARSRPYAAIRVGARLGDADAELTNRLIGQVIEGDVYLSSAAYSALSEAELPVDDMVDRLVDATGDETLTAVIPVSGLLHALVDALAQTTYAAAETATAAVADATQTASTVSPVDVVGVDEAVLTIASDAVVGAGDLVMSTIQATASSEVVEFTYGLPPPLGDSTLSLTYTVPGRQSVTTVTQPGEDGSDEAFSAAGYLQSISQVSSESLASDVTVPLWFELGGVRARIEEIQCARSGQPSDQVYVRAVTAPSYVGLGRFFGDDGERLMSPQPAVLIQTRLPAGSFGNPKSIDVKVTASGVIGLPAEQEDLVFESPFADAQQVGDRYRIADAMQQLPSQIELHVEVSGDESMRADEQEALEQSVEDAMRRQLRAVLMASADDFSRRVLTSAGFGAAGADVRVYGVELKEPYVFKRGG